MTNEVYDGDHITEFTSGNSKNYRYKIKNGKVCCKVRGFIFNVRGSAQLNYEVMRQNVLDEITDPLDDDQLNIDVVNPYDFVRDPALKRVKVVPRLKWYGSSLTNVWSSPARSSPIRTAIRKNPRAQSKNDTVDG